MHVSHCVRACRIYSYMHINLYCTLIPAAAHDCCLEELLSSCCPSIAFAPQPAGVDASCTLFVLTCALDRTKREGVKADRLPYFLRTARMQAPHARVLLVSGDTPDTVCLRAPTSGVTAPLIRTSHTYTHTHTHTTLYRRRSARGLIS